MRQISSTFTSNTRGPGLYDITHEVVSWVDQQDRTEGLLTLFMRHTSASLTIQENADPDVCRDLQDFFSRIEPSNVPYRHSA